MGDSTGGESISNSSGRGRRAEFGGKASAVLVPPLVVGGIEVV